MAYEISGTTVIANDRTVTAVEFVGLGALPFGSIIMWYGATNTVPSGWSLCNGNNGTPDLRNKFVVGAANNPGTFPIPKSITTGTKYTKAGIVCMTSSTGVIIACVLSDLAISIPIGMPMVIHKMVATEIIAIVAIVFSHIPSTPIPANEIIAPSDNFQLRAPK